MRSLRKASLVTALAAVAFAACGGNVVVDTGTSSSSGTTTGSGATTTTWTTGVGAGTTTPTTTTTGVGAGTTTPTTTWTTSTNVGGFGGGFSCAEDFDCPTCCVDQHSVAYEGYVASVLKLCACHPMAKCFGPCSQPGENACADTWAIGEACADCINAEFEAGNPCADEAQTICLQQPACSDMIDCFYSCP